MLVPEKCLEINNRYISREIYRFLFLRTVCNMSPAELRGDKKILLL